MSEIRIPESHRDLLDAAIPAALATVGAAGYPQVTAIWVIRDGDTVVSSLAGARQKLKNLRAHPQATIFVLDPTNPYRTLEIRGDVTIEPDPDLITLTRVLEAYGTDLQSFDGLLEDRNTVTLRPGRVVTTG
ncbi:PPOX class probable F420-dependent enzyme [Jatrophihabitans sp. GAS493]|uniref:PPOX class F420-dependent oxidoreductase n=1 Tax=Jatrophihabitans sp. GAS493 TaxID=1907575 RepID=UPI000BB97B46|nr:PPOX class F420-dependent oxidoreductase [Jatrophihabitans sp. GAS493]SOD74958.1 PPOX class probable F420-dependent enzyme [Jatrophihabitans sp. GAS493]